MILSESVLFFLSLVDSGLILFVLLYYVITLSDLECDYLNTQECCMKLNYWLLPKYIAHLFITFLLLLHGQVLLFILNVPMFAWLTFEYCTVPRGNLGVFDPAEILNQGQLRKHLRDILIYIGYHLIFCIIYMYYFIISVHKGNPVPPHTDEYVTSM